MRRWKLRFSSARERRMTRALSGPGRARLRRQGLRLVQVWLPDVRSRRFAAEARRQSLLVSRQRSERDIVERIERAADLAGWKA
jgi:hypothetical protein